MAAEDKKLEAILTEAGNALFSPPSSVEQLLILLREALRVIVAAFDNLSDISHCLYLKRVSILQRFAKIRLFIVMVDLECYDLIVDMFKHFFGNIREHHQDDVYSSMGFIMILVVEDSDEISVELVSTLLEFVRKENKEVLPKAWKLAKRVIHNCSSKLAPYMCQAVEHKGFPLDDYSKLVAFICQHSDARPEGLGGCEEDDSMGQKVAISGFFFEAATPENYDFPRGAITLGAENHSAKPDSSNTVPQESKRNSRKSLKDVSSSKQM